MEICKLRTLSTTVARSVGKRCFLTLWNIFIYLFFVFCVCSFFRLFFLICLCAYLSYLFSHSSLLFIHPFNHQQYPLIDYFIYLFVDWFIFSFIHFFFNRDFVSHFLFLGFVSHFLILGFVSYFLFHGFVSHFLIRGFVSHLLFLLRFVAPFLSFYLYPF